MSVYISTTQNVNNIFIPTSTPQFKPYILLNFHGLRKSSQVKEILRKIFLEFQLVVLSEMLPLM